MLDVLWRSAYTRDELDDYLVSKVGVENVALIGSHHCFVVQFVHS